MNRAGALALRLEALVCLSVAWVVRRWLPMRLWTRWLDTPLTHPQIPDTNTLTAVAAALAAVERRIYPYENCLVHGLAAMLMLRRRRVAARLVIGMKTARGDALALHGHAWVETAAGQTVGIKPHGARPLYSAGQARS